jgi:hypothetical protein
MSCGYALKLEDHVVMDGKSWTYQTCNSMLSTLLSVCGKSTECS